MAVITIIAGITLTGVVLVALAGLRRNLDDTIVKQSQQIRRLNEAVASLSQQQQAAQARIQSLSDTNRKLTDDLVAIAERLGDDDGSPRLKGSHRVLH